VTNLSRSKANILVDCADPLKGGVLMKHRMIVAVLATSFAASGACAADWPAAAQQFYGAGRGIPVEWTGLYFGVNAGYGWAQGSTDTFFSGSFQGGSTTPFGLGATELSGTKLHGSGTPTGALAGGQIGFNWQSGMAVFGAEFDAQWSGQQNSFTVTCTSGCTAAETVKIRSILTGRARLGLAFDWIMPYVTAGGAVVDVSDNLNITVGGVTGNPITLSGSTLGWTAGAGVEVALSSNWSARLEYLYIRVGDPSASTPIPGVLGAGTAFEGGSYRDNIVRVGLNYRFGPRGGPGVLETPLAAPAYRSAYDFSTAEPMFADKARNTRRPQTTPVVVDDATKQPAPVANINEIEVADAMDGLSAEPKEIRHSSKQQQQQQQKDEDENQRLKRIMTICSGC
jgi:outer membrane immunogenic protein